MSGRVIGMGEVFRLQRCRVAGYEMIAGEAA
jgi:hypothetical protein